MILLATGLVIGLACGLLWNRLRPKYRVWRYPVRPPAEPYDARIDQLADTARVRYEIHKAHHHPERRAGLPAGLREKAAATLGWGT